MTYCNPNHPFVVWASCYLWLISTFEIGWSLLLFSCIDDMLFITGTDLLNAVILLSGIIMLPTNVYMLCNIAKGQKINHNSKVLFCPLWLCVAWIISVNCLGAALCVFKIITCQDLIRLRINSAIKHYRNVNKYKHFIDNLQWSLRCCGLKSYKDWFDHEWYDKTRDYEWDPAQNKRHAHVTESTTTVSDSVPLSCCKSGSCIPNYLHELGTSSINTRGCGDLTFHIIIYAMILHLAMFMSIAIIEGLLLNFIIPGGLMRIHSSAAGQCRTLDSNFSDRNFNCNRPTTMNLKHIMAIKDNYSVSSTSLQLNPDDSDEFERIERLSLVPRTIGHIPMETE